MTSALNNFSTTEPAYTITPPEHLTEVSLKLEAMSSVDIKTLSLGKNITYDTSGSFLHLIKIMIKWHYRFKYKHSSHRTKSVLLKNPVATSRR